MIERLLTKLNTLLPYDKALHVIGGAVLAVVQTPVLGFCPTRSAVFGMAALVALIAALKELYDHLHPPHECSFYDWLATVMGSLLVLIPIFLTM